MNKKQKKQHVPADDLGCLLACQHLMDDFLKYAINPKLSSFTMDEKLRILELHQGINNLVIQLRIHYADCSDLLPDVFLSSAKYSDSNTKTVSNGKK